MRGWIDRCVGGRMDGLVDGWVSEWMDELVGGWMDCMEWMGGWSMDICLCTY